MKISPFKANWLNIKRGAEIFKEIINHKVEVERNKEIVILEKLKTNVERIRKHQSKECSYEPEEHYEALRSGDYYMFNAEFELDTTDITESEDDLMSTKKHHSSKSKQKKSSGKNSPLDEQSSSLKVDYLKIIYPYTDSFRCHSFILLNRLSFHIFTIRI
jgi:hypothetical protein